MESLWNESLKLIIIYKAVARKTFRGVGTQRRVKRVCIIYEGVPRNKAGFGGKSDIYAYPLLFPLFLFDLKNSNNKYYCDWIRITCADLMPNIRHENLYWVNMEGF